MRFTLNYDRLKNDVGLLKIRKVGLGCCCLMLSQRELRRFTAAPFYMVTKQDVENIALLSKLHVPEEELEALTVDMQGIIDFADTINNASEQEEEFDNINNLSNAFREDVVVTSYPSEEILKNAPEQAEEHFLVRKRG